MKKVLILAYDFPPYNSIGGQRPKGWYRYLQENGVYPIIITRQWNKEPSTNPHILPGYQSHTDFIKEETGEILYTPYEPNLRDKILLKKHTKLGFLISKTYTLWQVFTEFFFSSFDNKKNIFKEADKYLSNNKVDCIIATGEPFILFKYASKLSKKHSIPWIADYRDGWSTNYCRPQWLRVFYRPIEKQLVKSAKLITTPSLAFKDQLQKLFPAKKIEVIYNGYFEDLLQNLPVQLPTDILKIGFSGTLYPYQPIEDLVESLYKSIESQRIENFTFLFLGLENQESQMKRLIENLPNKILKNCAFTKKLIQKEAIRKLNECHILLLPANPRYPQLYAKVFEYMALNKAILYYKKDNRDLSHILASYKLCYSADNEHELLEASEKAITDYQKRNQNTTVQNQKYTRRESTAVLADIIKKIKTY
jgi:glycosyltransferase involved in cell wall biosynthesis